MKPMVEFCINNLTEDVEKLRVELEQDHELDVLETSCLGHCELCATSPYAMVNGEIVTGETAEELGRNIRKEIENYQQRMKDLFDLL
ncbi:Uncharacterized protein YuzB, UPF0349 family [Marininema mesophilum]|uniref:Uncharacterized protein YuzB, UPF0349 family n=1 Tax=Marininema mesophilum TaxID=1048340 RepID=A0A1H2ZV44_9BACL|nr:DUF1450 domain-containing protein [Marininema mesophilum]SDX21157.1 Uncharacterized protein YuzB, UPF0349 family [Marininema mesophilum]